MNGNKDIVLNIMRAQGKADALDLRERASDMDGTAIIAEENKAPIWTGEKDYSEWPIGSPVRFEGQVYTLITPHNAAHYPESIPSELPALWSVRHTKDASKAKEWVAPNGQSGLYAIDGCCIENGHVWRNKHDGNEFPPSAMPERWEDLGNV